MFKCLIYIASYTVLCTQWIENAETDLLNCLVPSHSWAFWSNIIILLLFKFFSSRKYHMLQMLLSYIFALGWLDNSIKTWSLKGFLRFSKAELWCWEPYLSLLETIPIDLVQAFICSFECFLSFLTTSCFFWNIWIYLTTEIAYFTNFQT